MNHKRCAHLIFSFSVCVFKIIDLHCGLMDIGPEDCWKCLKQGPIGL